MKLYLDSNVFISFVKSEFGRDYRQLGTASEMFFAVCKKNKFELILSDVFFEEVNVKLFLDETEICETMSDLGLIFTKAKSPNDLEIKAKFACKKLSTHMKDAMHYVIALEEKVDAFVTFNKKDFRYVTDYPVITPEEFID